MPDGGQQPHAPKPYSWRFLLGMTVLGIFGTWFTFKDFKLRPQAATQKTTVTPTTPAPCNPNDAQCLGARDHAEANWPCSKEIERQLEYAHEWTDGFLERRFENPAWHNPPNSIIYYGDSLRVQNVFGAWRANVRYFCAWDVHQHKVVKAKLIGR